MMRNYPKIRHYSLLLPLGSLKHNALEYSLGIQLPTVQVALRFAKREIQSARAKGGSYSQQFAIQDGRIMQVAEELSPSGRGLMVYHYWFNDNPIRRRVDVAYV